MAKLKACPYCGETEYLRVHNQSKNHYMECLQCGARGPENTDKDCGMGKNKAVDGWNHRSRYEAVNSDDK